MSSAVRSGALILAVLVLSACTRSHALFTEASAPLPAEAMSQVRVVQADALVVDGRRVHLVDAVTPQPAPDAGCPAEALAARQARLRMTELAGQARHVDVQATGAVDRYNRAEAHVAFDGADPAAVLIDEGLAVAPDKQAFIWCGPLSSGFPQARHMAMLSLSGS